MKIVFLDRGTVGEVPNIDKLRSFGELEIYETTTPDQTNERIRNANIVITNKVVIDETAIDSSNDLKLICVAATGTNNVDLEYAIEKGVAVKNVRDYSTNSVVQSTFALLLSLMNHISYYDDYVKTGQYSQSPVFTHHGREFTELKGKIFGIIGLGNIGRTVATIAESFQCRVIYYSTSGKNETPGFERVSFDYLLRHSDIISIHAPLTEKTKNLIRYRELTKMKKNCILLNIGRGSIISESDLARALNEELIGGAGIDVYDREPVDRENPLLKLIDPGRLILTPHVAWASIESRTLLIEKVCQNIQDFLDSP